MLGEKGALISNKNTSLFLLKFLVKIEFIFKGDV
jgi:hypothetical protein